MCHRFLYINSVLLEQFIQPLTTLYMVLTLIFADKRYILSAEK